MENIPVIRLNLEGIRSQITHAFMAHSEELNQMVAAGLEKALSADNLQERINEEVQNAIDDAIKSLSSNYTIRSIVFDIVSEALRSHNHRIHVDQADCPAQDEGSTAPGQ